MSNKNNKEILDIYFPNGRSIYNTPKNIRQRYNNHNRKRDFERIYNHFSTSHGIAFFSTKLEKHYITLNKAVFQFLAPIKKGDDIEDVPEDNLIDILKIKVYLPIHSTIYKYAIHHMNKDCPSLSEKIDKLDKELNNHNLKINDLDNLIRNVITNSFIKKTNTPIISYNSKYDIDEENAREAALKSWKHIYEKMNQPQQPNIIKYFEKELQNIGDHIKKSESEQNELLIHDLLIGKGSNTNEIDNIYGIFENDILKDKEIIQKLSDIIKNRFTLNEGIKEIEELSFHISNDINNDAYDTIAECCPTFRKLLWKLFTK